MTIPERPKYGWCKKTGKRRFRTEIDADRVLSKALYRARVLDDHKRREQRVYECEHCDGWHLTSKGRRAA